MEHPYVRLLQAVALAGLIGYGLLQLGLIGSEPNPPTVSRIQGEDPVLAAATAAREAYPSGADTVLLVGAESLSDGVVATGLAGAMGAPILLTDPVELSTGTRDVIVELGAREVVVMGGRQAVDPLVARTLEVQMGLDVRRVAGVTRFDTAWLAAQEFLRSAPLPSLGDNGATAMVVDSADLTAALEAGAVAAGHDGPIPVLLSDTGSLPQATRSALLSLGVEHVIAVGEPVEFDGPVTLVDSPGAAATSAADLRGFRPARVVLVPAGDDARTLVAAPLAGITSGVVLPVGPAARDWLTDACETVSEIIVFGDPEQIPDGEVALLVDATTTCSD